LQNPIPIKFGGGKADALGLKKHKKDSTGIEIWPMAKVKKVCELRVDDLRTISAVAEI